MLSNFQKSDEMCGIFGHTIINKESDIEKSRLALNTLSHRGPDQWNDWQNDKVYSGQRRLSILDLSENGKQPMINPDQSTVITVNGEIYNFQGLREELKGKYHFKSNSDSEVVLLGYDEWGIEELLHRLDGMYAGSIYDVSKNKLYLFRDRVGIKPLYYSFINGQLAWSSELKAITKLLGEENLEVDKTAVYDYLTYGYIPAPKSLYKGIYKLLPAQYLEFSIENQSLSTHTYWELKCSEIKITREEASEQVKKLIRKSVAEQMISDVPVGFFLSGGIDSSIVSFEGSKCSGTIQTYTIGFDDPKHDESQFAKQIADLIKSNHHQQVLDLNITMNLFENLKSWYDEPFADTSAFPSYMVSKFAKQSSTVVLTGDGGDEVFGGYKWYSKFKQFAEKRSFIYPLIYPLVGMASSIFPSTKLIKAKRRISMLCQKDDLALYAKLLGGLIKEEKVIFAKKWNIPADYDDYWHFRKYYKPELPVFTRLQYMDFHTYMPDDIFTKVDRVSMAVSLEARVPLLSKEIIEFSFSLPENIRILNGELKGLLKFAYKNDLPQEILYRKKRGFSIPLRVWGKQFLEQFGTKEELILNKLFPNLTK